VTGAVNGAGWPAARGPKLTRDGTLPFRMLSSWAVISATGVSGSASITRSARRLVAGDTAVTVTRMLCPSPSGGGFGYCLREAAS
jgi:hypothetical protein